ncbi:hypothetical protein JTB14_022738 [Gonioctena quinquepunctata]|nr:hypothetical protein JTB14_022738 [Gonioctena quinquepunctata]
MVLGALRSISSIYCEAGEPSLYRRRQYLSLSFASTIASNTHHPSFKYVFANRFRKPFSNRIRIAHPFFKRLNRYPITSKIDFRNVSQTYFLNTPPWHIPKLHEDTSLCHFRKTETPPKMIVQAFKALLSRYQEHSHCYTDASKSEDKVGAAFVFQEEVKRYPLPPSTSVFSGEIFAIFQAVKYITSHGIQKATLITDSLSAVETLE